MSALSPIPWLEEPAVRTLLHAAQAQRIEVRFVGGCVRNLVIQRAVTDIDLATPMPAEQAMERLRAQGLKIVPTGIAHGTVTAVIEGDNFEITTLRRDVETDGRHAKVIYTDNWQEDAARRDFTMNALYLTPKGELLDYFGGVEDARAGRVRFIGDADTRIREDALRILRFFRFHAQYGIGEMDREAVAACTRHAGLIDRLSGERIQREMLKLLRVTNPIPVLQSMAETKVWNKVFPNGYHPKALSRLLEVEKLAGFKPCTKLRMAALLKRNSETDFLRSRWKVPKAFHEMVTDLVDAAVIDAANQSQIKKLVRSQGARRAVKFLLWQWSNDERAEVTIMYQRALSLAQSWQPPAFPVTGADLQALGMNQGKTLGDTLKTLEAIWEESGYILSKGELIKKVENRA